MSFIEELKNNRDKQIMAISIVFFVLSFPAYFYLSAQGADDFSVSTAVATYEIDGERQYFELTSGDEFIVDGDPLVIDNMHTDSIDDADDMNIVGVRLTMTYTEAEDTNGGAGCAGPQGGQPAADTISGTTMHGEYNETASGSNNGNSGSHSVELYWISNVSLLDAETVTMSKSDIIAEIDAGGLGLGAYMAEISVDAEAGNAPGPFCDRTDAGEDVAYIVEIIVFDYDIRPYVDLEEL